MTKIAILIDGGHLRAIARKNGADFTPDFIESFSAKIPIHGEQLLRVLYYDCAPFHGARKRPISGESIEFDRSDDWLHDLAARDFLAVRRGVLKWRGWKPKSYEPTNLPLTDDDFRPDFEQKGVDLRIGLDIAIFSFEKTVDRIALISGDTDLIPAMKLARRSGLQVVGIEMPRHRISREMAAHFDLTREVGIPITQ